LIDWLVDQSETDTKRPMQRGMTSLIYRRRPSHNDALSNNYTTVAVHLSCATSQKALISTVDEKKLGLRWRTGRRHSYLHNALARWCFGIISFQMAAILWPWVRLAKRVIDPRIETTLCIMLTFQFDGACFQTRGAKANFGVSNNIMSVFLAQT